MGTETPERERVNPRRRLVKNQEELVNIVGIVFRQGKQCNLFRQRR